MACFVCHQRPVDRMLDMPQRTLLLHFAGDCFVLLSGWLFVLVQDDKTGQTAALVCRV